jgi:biotin synthase-like enzyme
LRDTLISGTSNKSEQYKNSCYEVMVHKLCNEKCFFCSQDHASRTTDIKPNDIDIYQRILYGAKQGYGMLGFTG